MENKNIVIGIEGLVGAGKTSICRELLNEIPNSVLLNGGNLYRAIISTLLKNEKSEISKLIKRAKNLDVKQIMDKLGIIIKIENKETCFYCNNVKIEEDEMQSTKSSMAVTSIGGLAYNTELFTFAKDLIENLKNKYNVIVSGRSLMQIYPKMDYHLFIIADIDKRVERKLIQYKQMINKDEMKEHIITRDKLQEKAGFYELSDKTITIDVTDCKSVEESTKKVLNEIGLITV